MPSLDMSDALLEPQFQDNFAILRRKQSVSDKGRAVISASRIDGFGVVTAASPNDLERLGDYQFQGSALSIVTKYKLRGVSKTEPEGQQYQPDIIEWGGSFYLVVTIQDYSRYGSGFIQAICVSTTYTDDAPGEGAFLQIGSFDVSANSGLIPCV